MAAKIRKGDTVQVMVGRDKSRQGTVVSVDRQKDRAVVEQVNMVWRHQKPDARGGRGGRVQKESSISLSNLMLVHKGEPTRVGFRVVDGKKVRWSKRHDEAIDA